MCFQTVKRTPLQGTMARTDEKCLLCNHSEMFIASPSLFIHQKDNCTPEYLKSEAGVRIYEESSGAERNFHSSFPRQDHKEVIISFGGNITSFQKINVFSTDAFFPPPRKYKTSSSVLILSMLSFYNASLFKYIILRVVRFFAWDH